MRWLPGPCLCLARPRVTSGQVEAALKTSGCEMERWSLSLFDPASYEENYRGAHTRTASGVPLPVAIAVYCCAAETASGYGGCACAINMASR